ncbi:hypothetical protein AB0M36_18310 [Actinoplanes sp. NPDC051346]|uniref:hypothetical protein n=1 Tax=Actinoplanes sp. NPDC051346 TaxID=3155048 RepID=UPI003419EE07
MKRPIIVAATLTAAALLAITVAAAVERPAGPREHWPVLPALHQFTPGTCRDAADAVLALARLTRRDIGSLSPADREELRRLQERFVALQPAATGEAAASMRELVLALGYLRLRLDSRTGEPRYLREAEDARSHLEQVCVGGGSAPGTR